MGLTSKKQKIENSLPDTLDSFQLGQWRVIYERKVTPSLNSSVYFGYNVFSSKIKTFVDTFREVPLKRYILECYELGPIFFSLYVFSQLFIGCQSAMRLHYSNKLFQVVCHVLCAYR